MIASRLALASMVLAISNPAGAQDKLREPETMAGLYRDLWFDCAWREAESAVDTRHPPSAITAHAIDRCEFRLPLYREWLVRKYERLGFPDPDGGAARAVADMRILMAEQLDEFIIEERRHRRFHR